MLDAITEEHKIHGGIVSIVNFETLVKLGNKLVNLAQLDVLRTILVVTKKHILVVLDVPTHIKVAFHLFLGKLVKLSPV